MTAARVFALLLMFTLGAFIGYLAVHPLLTLELTR